jgi:hypothetical protein
VKDFNKALFTNTVVVSFYMHDIVEKTDNRFVRQPHAMAISEEDLPQSQANLLDLTQSTKVTAIGESHGHSVKNDVSEISEEVVSIWTYSIDDMADF